jgi:hypothetical protein
MMIDAVCLCWAKASFKFKRTLANYYLDTLELARVTADNIFFSRPASGPAASKRA